MSQMCFNVMDYATVSTATASRQSAPPQQHITNNNYSCTSSPDSTVEPRPPSHRKKTSPSTKKYHKQQQDKFREKKGAEVLEAHDAELRKSLLCGFDSIEDVIKGKGYEDTKRSVILPVSTSVAGFSTVTALTRVMSTEANRQRLPPITYAAFYRVMLAMIERMIIDNRLVTKVDNREQWYDPHVFEQYKTVITSATVATQQVGALVKSLSAFKYGDVNYVPLFPRGKLDPHGRLIPTPENVHLTNLRDVVSLADHRIQRRVRQNFINKNPLPGALFNGDAILTKQFHIFYVPGQSL